MLKQILAEFEQSPTMLCLDELSQKLAVTPSALEGMLDMLVRKGRLLEISAAHSACTSCPARAGCVIIRSSAKSYILAPSGSSR
jgi:hypothetical protein